MTRRMAVLSAALVVLSAGFAAGPRPARGEDKPKAPVTVDLSGRWISQGAERRRAGEDARRHGGARGPGGGGRRWAPAVEAAWRGGTGGRVARPGGGGRTGPPPGRWAGDDARESMRAIFEPAEELAIAQTGAEIAIDEKFGRMRRLHPDGKKYKTDNGASEIKTSWKEGKLRRRDEAHPRGQRGRDLGARSRPEPPDRGRQDGGRLRAERRR